MGRECAICGNRTIFFIWGSSRVLKKAAISIVYKLHLRYIDSLDVVCLCCCDKYNLLEKRPALDMNKPIKYVTWDDMRR